MGLDLDQVHGYRHLKMFMLYREGIMRCLKRILPGLFYLLLLNISSLAGAPHAFAEDIIRLNGSGSSLEMIMPLAGKAGILITGGGI
jgi:hypothetical protein